MLLKNTAQIGTICPKSRAEWREWLMQHHESDDAVWLVYHKKNSGIPRVAYKEAVEEALCFGWIDSRSKPIDEATYMQFFCKRKPVGTWSKINKQSILRLTEQGLMTQAGLDVIETAKQNGSWVILDEVEELLVPEELQKALDAEAGAATYFDALSRSDKRAMLQWLVLAKRPETRRKRIDEIASCAAAGRKPKPFSR
jgi:uncharacterized protein YdeI (YjbR/CyaY-like superfamily)